MNKYRVESKRTNTPEIFDNYIGDYIETNTKIEAVEIYAKRMETMSSHGGFDKRDHDYLVTNMKTGMTEMYFFDEDGTIW